MESLLADASGDVPCAGTSSGQADSQGRPGNGASPRRTDEKLRGNRPAKISGITAEADLNGLACPQTSRAVAGRPPRPRAAGAIVRIADSGPDLRWWAGRPGPRC